MDYTRILNVSQLITKDRNSVSDLEKARKEPARLFKKPLSKMALKIKMLFQLKNEMNIKKSNLNDKINKIVEMLKLELCNQLYF